MGSGRALGIAYVNNAPVDVIHAEVAIAANGQDGITGHIRARLTATGIVWETWNYKVEGAATWTLPRTVTLGLSTGKFIHSGGPTLQQEVDANARRSNNPDTGATWKKLDAGANRRLIGSPLSRSGTRANFRSTKALLTRCCCWVRCIT